MLEFKVQHKTHDAEFIGAPLKPIHPTWSYRKSDSAQLQCSFALSDPNLEPLHFGPKRTDFNFYATNTDNDNTLLLIDGICSAAKLGGITGTVEFVGNDYLYYLNGTIYPFDEYTDWNWQALDTYLNGGANRQPPFRAWTPTGTVLDIDSVVNGHTISDFLEHIRTTVAPEITLDFNYTGIYFDLEIYYLINFFDTTSLKGHIDAIASLTAPVGFDYYATPLKTVNFFGPRVIDYGTVIPDRVLADGDACLLDILEWQNTGPDATLTIGIGPTSNTAEWDTSLYTPSVDVFRKWLKIHQLGDKYRYINGHPDPPPAGVAGMLNAKTGALGISDRSPNRTMKIRIDPYKWDATDPIVGFRQHLGELVQIQSFKYQEYRTFGQPDSLDQPTDLFWIVQQDYDTDDAGNFYCDLSLERATNGAQVAD